MNYYAVTQTSALRLARSVRQQRAQSMERVGRREIASLPRETNAKSTTSPCSSRARLHRLASASGRLNRNNPLLYTGPGNQCALLACPASFAPFHSWTRQAKLL